MRYEGKSEREAVEAAAKALRRPAEAIPYRVVRDEKSFWGGRVVEIEVEGVSGGAPEDEAVPPAEPPPAAVREEDEETWDARPAQRPRAARESRQNPAHDSDDGAAPDAARREPAPAGATDAEAVAAVESTLTELLSAAGLLVEIRRRESTGDELLFELFGDDVEPLLANKGEGLTGLEVLAGRIASKRLGVPVHPRLDAEGFRAHRKEALEELARNSADEVRRSRRPQLLPPLAPWERRLVHLALSDEQDVETESEGDGFMKRVEVRLKR